MAFVILLLLLNMNEALATTIMATLEEENVIDTDGVSEFLNGALPPAETLFHVALHYFCLWSSFAFFDEDLGFWVKPRSTTWFSKFFIEEYNDDRWVLMFCMTKQSIFSLAQLLVPTVYRKDAKYWHVVLVIVCVACTLFKLSHGTSLLVYSEMFVVGRSMVSIMLRDVIHAINVALRSQITWPTGDMVTTIARDFQHLCGLPSVVGAIEGTHFAISKPRYGLADYYYFKSGGYMINCQVVVDSLKHFLDLYVGMPSSTNNSKMLRRSFLYQQGQRNILWDNDLSLISWIFTLLVGRFKIPAFALAARATSTWVGPQPS